eukprot:GEMP01000429.1.p1 GENE.GEMP01000429.1~~GEMP01000429.1.p1  ORF type:complete len:1703 (+),score=505.89 GEMP01000429.1:149-5257(+)
MQQQQQFPIVSAALMSLADMGVNASAFKFGALTMESDKYICAKDTASDGSSQVVVIDMHNGNALSRKPMKAEASLMNSVDNIMALKGKNEGTPGHFIQVFNLDSKEKLGVHQFPENVVFWKWAQPRLLAVVTDRSVYHWKLDGSQAAPELIFARGGKLAEAGTQIIAYAVNNTCTWCLLTGISTQDGGKTIDGNMQLYSIDRKQQQMLEGHAGAFGNIPVGDGEQPAGLLTFAERKQGAPRTVLHVMDVGGTRTGLPPFKINAEISMPPEAPTDFAVAIHLSARYGVIFMVTKAGFLFMFDATTANMIFRTRISQEPIFLSTDSTRSGGCIFVNRKGVVQSVSVNENGLVNYIINNLPHLANRQDIAFTLARRFGLPGCDDLFIQQFQSAFASGDYKEAARIAAQAKSGSLRSSDTIQRFKQVQNPPGQQGPSPILQYFSTLLEFGKLNAEESLELVRPVVTQGRREFVEKWLTEDKLECTEDLGDVVKPMDSRLALSIYVRGNAHQKAMMAMLELGEVDKVIQYVKKVNCPADYSQLLRTLIASNPQAGVNFAKELCNENGSGQSLMQIDTVVDIFMSQNRLQEVTSLLLDVLKDNKPEHGPLQTKLLQMNLMQSPQVAEAIFQMNMFTHYDRSFVAQLCEKAGNMQRALEHYSEAKDVKRVLANASNLSSEFLIQYCGSMAPEACLECMCDLLRTNRQNLQVVVQLAIKTHEKVGAMKLVEMFEQINAVEGIFYFLGAILAFSQDGDVHFKYIQAAARLGNMQEVERVCRESQSYDPVKVKDFLKESKLSDPRPLIYVCDLHNYVQEMTEYLHANSLMKYIEVYVMKVNPQNTPMVVGTLIDLDCSEDFIKNLLQAVRGQCPIERLVEEVEKRNRLRIILPWLEARVAEGQQEPALHNALAMIYIDTNRDAENFLKNNAFYDSAVVGKYCEERDPHLAFTAYKRAWGSCDEQLVSVTNKNGLFRLQARYLVERQSPELWAMVLENPENEFRSSVIDQIVGTALPESTNPDEVSVTVKAFIQADIPEKLAELLEKIVLHKSDFANNRNLQNLLILTAIKFDKSRVMDYINRLDNYDGPEIAKIALGEPYRLYEEAFLIYKNCKMQAEAMDTLLTNIDSLERAAEFAARINDPVVWYKLGKALLHSTQPNAITEAIECYLKAEDCTDYMEVIEAAENEEKFDDLVNFLKMARANVKDQHIDSELVYAYAKSDALADMEEFISGTTTANIQAVGDRLYDEKFFKAAKILYASIPNNARLASCHVQLGEYSQAVEAAKKANSPKTWREVNIACVEAEEFRFAQIAAMHIIVHPDHLEELIMNYERHGYFEELMSLLDSGLGNERAHVGMYTELAILYAKYKPDKLQDFINLNTQRLNIPKVIRACERHALWSETVFLYIHYDEFDSAANTMMQHSGLAWTHDQFLLVMQKVSNMELLYRAVSFYLEEHPLEINSLLNTISSKVDHARVVQQLRKNGHLPLIQPYLKQVQQHNIQQVNDALNDLYLDGEDYEELRESVDHFDNFDQIALAQRLERHELTEMRRLAALIYKNNKRYKQSIELSKQDMMFKDAMETARDSANAELAETLLRYFVDKQDSECFCAMLYTCYDLIRPDVGLELAWRNRQMDFAMPYLIQVVREFTSRVSALDRKVEHEEEEKKKAASAPNDYAPDYSMGMGGLTGMGNLALMPPQAHIQANPQMYAPPF